MKWYPNIATAIIAALDEIFNQQKQGDKVINLLLKKQKKWGSKDRKFVAKVLYDIIRWKRYYEYLSNEKITTLNGKWQILAVWSILNDISLPDWPQFKTVSKKDINYRKTILKDEKIKQSVPDWLFETGLKELGDIWVKELIALNQEAHVVLRVNSLKTTPKKLQAILLKEGVQTYKLPDYPSALFLKKHQKLTHLKSFQKGFFEIQDASSQLVAPFTGVKPGDTVIDACAGAGGKTLHLAALMKNKGILKAYDIFPSKIKELKKRARRNGVKNIVESGIIDQNIIENNKGTADILLIDAPCSSLGTLKRKPDLKWKLNPEKLIKITVNQLDILEKYTEMLRAGGFLIYATCSILPSENTETINNFLKKHKNFTFVEQKIIMPSNSEGDGFYMAKLKKQTL